MASRNQHHVAATRLLLSIAVLAAMMFIFAPSAWAGPVLVTPVGEVVILKGLDNETLIIAEGPLAGTTFQAAAGPGPLYTLESDSDDVSDITTWSGDNKASTRSDINSGILDPDSSGNFFEPFPFDNDVSGLPTSAPAGATTTREGIFAYKSHDYEYVYIALSSSDAGFDTTNSSPVTYLFDSLEVPEPSSLIVWGTIGAAGLFLCAWRRRGRTA